MSVAEEFAFKHDGTLDLRERHVVNMAVHEGVSADLVRGEVSVIHAGVHIAGDAVELDIAMA